MKKLLIILLLLTAPLMSALVPPKTNPAQATAPAPTKAPAPATAPAQAAMPQGTVDEENDDDDETEAVPAAAQTPAPKAVTPPATPVVPSDKTASPAPVQQELSASVPKEDTRPLAVFNKTGRTIALYGKSEDDTAPKLLTTLQANSAPAQIVFIPSSTLTVFVEDEAKSNALSVEEGPQLITIEIASSVGTFTYTLDSIVPEYGEHITVHNATDNDQIVIMKTSAKVPGIFSLTTTTQSYAYTIPAQTMQLITIPQLALPATQNKKVECGLPSSAKPLTINSDEQNMFIITQDNETPVIHKV